MGETSPWNCTEIGERGGEEMTEWVERCMSIGVCGVVCKT